MASPPGPTWSDPSRSAHSNAKGCSADKPDTKHRDRQYRTHFYHGWYAAHPVTYHRHCGNSLLSETQASASTGGRGSRRSTRTPHSRAPHTRTPARGVPTMDERATGAISGVSFAAGAADLYAVLLLYA